MSETNARVAVTIGTKAETAPVDRYAASVNRMQGAIKNLFASHNVATLGAAFSAGALSVQSMVHKISEAIAGSSELASEMAQVERRVGLAGEAFQVLSRAGKATSEELIAALAKYRVKLGEALAGDKDARKLFAGLGLSPEMLTNMPMERQLESVGVAINRFSDRNRQAAEAQAIFGRGYTAMVPVLQKLGTDGYDHLREKVEATAGVLGDDMAAALSKAKKGAAEAGNALSISLAETNVRLLKMKTAITTALADNAGSIQSAGLSMARGFLTASVLTQIVSRAGPQLQVFGSQVYNAWALKGFLPAMLGLPRLMAARIGGPEGQSIFAGLGKALATPFGAAFALVVGGFLIAELERISLEKIEQSSKEGERAAEKYRAIQDSIKKAASPADALKAQVDAAKFLSESAVELSKLQAKKKALEDAPVTLSSEGDAIRPELSAYDTERLGFLENEVQLRGKLVLFANAQAQAIAAKNAAQQKSTDLAFAESAELEKSRAKRDGLMEREKQNRYDALTDDKAKLQFLQQWRAEESAAFQEKADATKNVELRSDIELEKRVKLADIDAKIAQVRQHAADESERSAAAAEREVEQMLERLDRERRHEIVRSLDSELAKAAVARAQVEGDFTKTNAEKWGARLQEIEARVSAVNSAMQDMEARKRTAGAMGLPTDQHEGDLQRMRDELAQLQIDRSQSGPNPTSWVEQTAASLTQLRDQWGTTEQQIGAGISGTLGTAVNSLADNITQAMLVTGDWGQALQNVEMMIGTEIVHAIISMGVRWVATQLMMAVAGKAMAAASVAATVPIATAQSAVWAAPATLATIATFGGAAAAAPVEIAAATMATTLQSMAGFSKGGYTGEDGGIVHPKEYVFSAPAVDSIGLDNLESMHRAALNPASPSSSGAAAGGRSDKYVKMVWLSHDDKKGLEEELNDPRASRILMQHIRARRGELGVNL